jgi:hypothetical protein
MNAVHLVCVIQSPYEELQIEAAKVAFGEIME